MISCHHKLNLMHVTGQREIEAQRSIARDLAKNVPRTDFTSVKARIAAGNFSFRINSE